MLLRRQREHTLDPVAYTGPFEVQQKLGETQYLLRPARGRDGRQLDPSLTERRRVVHFDRLFKVQPPHSFLAHQEKHQQCRDDCPCRLNPTNVRDKTTQCPIESHDALFLPLSDLDFEPLFSDDESLAANLGNEDSARD